MMMKGSGMFQSVSGLGELEREKRYIAHVKTIVSIQSLETRRSYLVKSLGTYQEELQALLTGFVMGTYHCPRVHSVALTPSPARTAQH